MEYNKEGEVYKCYDLDSILSMDISERVKEEFRQKFKKNVYFGFKTGTKVGKLIGLEVNYKLSDLYYIIQGLSSEDKLFLNVENSISLL